MSFAREGYPAMAMSGAVAITTLAVSVWRRRWSIWLIGFMLLLVTAGVAWQFRTAPAAHDRAATALISAVTAHATASA